MRKQDKDLNVKPEALLWLDFETTGTDRDGSLPLEVGMECTDVLGEHSYGSLHRIIRPDYLDLLDMSPIVFSMHTDNGLLFELSNGSAGNDCVGAVANAVEEYLESLSQRFTLVPAGTNVDFDIDFLKRLDLNPDRWLSYRKFDLTTLRRYLRFIDCPEDPYKTHAGTHRVRDCIRRDINDYIRYRKLLKGARRGQRREKPRRPYPRRHDRANGANQCHARPAAAETSDSTRLPGPSTGKHPPYDSSGHAPADATASSSSVSAPLRSTCSPMVRYMAPVST